MAQFRSLPRSAQLYLVCVIAAGAGVLVFGWLVNPVQAATLPTLLYLGVGTQIAALRPIPWGSGRQQIIDPLLVATGLLAPGAGVGLLAWLAVFDGRVPGKAIPWWTFLFNRAMSAIAHVLPSLAFMPLGTGWGLPVRTALYVLAAVGLNYVLTALTLSFTRHISVFTVLFENVGLPGLAGTVALSFSGGIIFLLLQSKVGYIMAPGLFGFVLAVRGNVADAQRQTLLKDQTLDLAAQALDARDRYTESHSIRVSELAGRLGEHLELGDREVEMIRTAGALHDLGKIGVRDDILNKPGPLNEDEWEIMRRHPDIGADMIAQHSALAEVAPIVRHHHERWDGSGYPGGLTGETIPFGARILAVADSFDTVTGTRLYRPSLMTPIEGVEDISRRANAWYDPNVVDALRDIHGLKPLEVMNRPEVPRRITAFRVIRSNPGFSNLLAAVAISSLGDPLTQVATLVTVYIATNNAAFVALAFITQALATIAMSTTLGGITDRIPRRGLLVGCEVLRATILVATGLTVGTHRGLWWLIIPAVFCLAAINAVVQPARQAAIPTLVPVGQVGKANAIVAAGGMLAGAVGFGLAGALLAAFRTTVPLFIADGVTFALAAAIVATIPNLGGGVKQVSLSGAFARAWSGVAIRQHLVLGALASFFLPMSYPALIVLAYKVSTQMGQPTLGGQTYSVLELVLSTGIFVGSVVIARFGAIGTMRTVGAGLFVTGAFSVGIALTHDLLTIAIFLWIASIGNPIYAVANQTAIVEAADQANRGSVMAVRFGLVQTASIIGIAAGGLIAQMSPWASYGVLGIGLVLLAMYAIAAGRSTTNPLHGEKYEEAVLRQANT